MRQKIIFIDIDGPLAWGSWDDGSVTINEDRHTQFEIPYAWDKADCEALKTIIDETNAKLVLSSDWRFQFSFRQMKDIFQHPFKWMTPRIPMWRHVQVDGDWGFGGRLRDKIEECINKLNR